MSNESPNIQKRSRAARLLLVLAWIVTLIALFYAEEDWRGWHKWHHFKTAWEAKGEHFNVASVVPPPVPEEENFAMTPLVFTSYGYILTRDGKVIPNKQRDPHFEIRMHMPVAHNDNPPPDSAGDRTKGTFTKLDHWQSYYREQAAKTNEFPVHPIAQSPAEDVLYALSKYDSRVEELRAAVMLPASRFPVDYDNESPWAILLPHLAQLKSCAILLQLRSAAELQDNQPERASDDVRLTLQLSDTVHSEPILISHLVRIVMVQAALQTVWEGLAQHRWSEAQLTALDAELAKLDFVADWKVAMRGDVTGQNDEMELIRRHPEHMQDIGDVWDSDGGRTHYSLPMGLMAHLIPSGWFYQNEYRCARLMENYFIPTADVAHNTFVPDVARQGGEVLAEETKSFGLFNLYERIMLPALENAPKKFAYAEASVDLARTAMALERYRLAHG